MQNPAAKGERNRFSSVVYAELHQDIFDMHLHRIFSDGEGGSYLLIALAGRNLLQHIQFSRRQFLVAEVIDNLRGDGSWNMALARVHRSDGIEQLLPHHAFDYIAACTGGEG